MVTVAYVLVVIAMFAACFIAKLVIVDIGWADYRGQRSGSTAKTLAVCVAVGAALVAIPFVLAGGLLNAGHPIWASVVALGSLALSGAGIIVLAPAFRP